MIRKSRMALALPALVALAWLAAGCSKSSTTLKSASNVVAEKPAATANQPGTSNPGVVLVQAYYPLTAEHKFIKDYMMKLPAKYPGKVKVEFYDSQTAEGQAAWEKTGLSCFGVFIDGRIRHLIPRANGKKAQVDFLKRMDVYWTRADFESALKQEIAHPRPLPPGGFSLTDTGTGGAAKPAGKGA